MKGTIIRGKVMDEGLQMIVSNTLGHFAIDDSYFIAETPMGLLIFDVQE